VSDEVGGLAAAESGGVRRLAALVRQAFSFVWQADRRAFLTILVLQVVGGVALGAELYLGKVVLEALGHASDPGAGIGQIAGQLLALAVLAFVVALGGSVTTVRSEVLAETVSRAAQQQVLDVATAVDLASFDDPKFHDHVKRSVENATWRPWQLVNGLVGIASALAALAAAMVVLLSVQPLIALVGLFAYLPVWFVTRRNTRDLFEAEVSLTGLDRERWYLVSLMTGRETAAELRALDADRFLLDRYESINTRVLERLRQVARVRLSRSVKATGGSVLIVLVAMFLAIEMAYANQLSTASAAVLVIGVQQLGAQLRGLSAGVGRVYECSLFLGDLDGFLALAPSLAAQAVPADRVPDARSVQIDHIAFRYPGADELALDGVTIRIEPGEIVALVGENGSGKTTLAKLVAGLYDPSAGSVCWDGVDLAGVPPYARRGRVALVFQDFLRLHYSATENIAVGDWRRDDPGRVRWAAGEADVDGFVRALPQGYDTRLGREFEEGTELSVGQWQRLALARTLYSSCPLVVFDEPTAALDPRAEVAFFATFRSMVQGRTALVISHRMISARMADRVYVLEHGRVIEHGTHIDLVAAGGRYAEMVAAQELDQ
jgi:ATP-binding cassette subfamily B protein